MKQLHFYDKTEWLRGPWLDEPDYQSWLDDPTHYACVARRNVMGAWCGMVGVDPLHPLYRSDVHCQEFKYIDVHGNVTFADWAPEDDKHFYPARRLWWIGFDCMQDEDLCPAFRENQKKSFLRFKKDQPTIYRNLEFVKDNIEFLSSQLSTFDPRFFN